MQFVGRRRSSTGFGVVAVAAAGILSLVVAACAPVPPQPPSTGVDLTVTVTGAKAVVGASASYGATVANVGTQTATDLVSATVVAPPSQPITGVDAAGWSCATAADMYLEIALVGAVNGRRLDVTGGGPSRWSLPVMLGIGGRVK